MNPNSDMMFESTQHLKLNDGHTSPYGNSYVAALVEPLVEPTDPVDPL